MLMGTDDTTSVEAARIGNLEAFAGLVEKYQGRIYRVVFRIVKDVADAEDVTQETFIHAFRALETFRADSAFFTWLYRIALNNALNCRLKQRHWSVRFESGDEDLWEAIECMRPAGFSDTPLDCLERKQTLQTVERLLEEMPEKFSDALMSLVVEGMSCTDMSARFAVSPNTVRTRVFRAREFLARRMPDFQLTARATVPVP